MRGPKQAGPTEVSSSTSRERASWSMRFRASFSSGGSRGLSRSATEARPAGPTEACRSRRAGGVGGGRYRRAWSVGSSSRLVTAGAGLPGCHGTAFRGWEHAERRLGRFAGGGRPAAGRWPAAGALSRPGPARTGLVGDGWRRRARGRTATAVARPRPPGCRAPPRPPRSPSSFGPE
jgi:hypothetical protein